jgi:hypothetical protein
VNGSGNHRGGAPAEDFSPPHLRLGMCVLFGPLNLVGTANIFMIRYLSVAFHGTILNGCSMYVVGCHAELEMLIVDPGNTAYGMLIGDSQVRGGTSESSWLIRNALYGITTALEKPNILYLYKGSIDDCAQDALRLYGTSDVELYSQLRSSGNIGYGIHIVGEDAPPGWSCRVKITLSWALTYGGLVGALGEINLDGYVFTYADLNSEPSRCFVSDRCSWVKGV